MPLAINNKTLSLIRIRRQRLKARSNPNFARKSPIRSMVDFVNDDGPYFSDNPTIVFWNFEDYPIPDAADLVSIYRNIESALYQMGFCKLDYIHAFGDKLRQDRSALRKAGFIYSPEAPEVAALEMAREMVTITPSFVGPLNIVVIAKQNPKSELNRVLHCLKSRNNPVLLVQPPDDTSEDSVFHSVDALVNCTQLLGGEKPISIRPQSSDSGTAADYEEDPFRWRKLYFYVE